MYFFLFFFLQKNRFFFVRNFVPNKFKFFFWKYFSKYMIATMIHCFYVINVIEGFICFVYNQFSLVYPKAIGFVCFHHF
eukprot:GSMAST32.ASY1.ANO1.468.1 assembled CDS